MDVNSGRLVADIKSVPEHLRHRFTEVPDHLREFAEKALDGQPETVVNMRRRNELTRWAHGIKEALAEKLAALSALPAVGGEVDKREIATFICDKLAGFRKVDAQLREDIAMAVLCMRPLATIPQPSAAEWAERASPHGPWIHGHRTRGDFPPPDAAVGAQGDGWAMTDAEIEQWIGACNYGKARDTLRHYLRLRATPAAGKGVDDAISRACIRFVADDGSMHESPEAAERHNALTRQPVAGDGWIERVRAWANTLQSADRTTLHRLLDELTGPAQGDGK